MAKEKEIQKQEVPVQTDTTTEQIKNLCEEGCYGNVED